MTDEQDQPTAEGTGHDEGAEQDQVHQAPLENDDDARFLDPSDPRRIEAEQRRGKPFSDDDDEAGQGTGSGEASQPHQGEGDEAS